MISVASNYFVFDFRKATSEEGVSGGEPKEGTVGLHLRQHVVPFNDDGIEKGGEVLKDF